MGATGLCGLRVLLAGAEVKAAGGRGMRGGERSGRVKGDALASLPQQSGWKRVLRAFNWTLISSAVYFYSEALADKIV